MRRTVGNFASLVAEKGPDTVALVFYAGHGLQVDGENYLVPIDASIQREADVPLQAMRLTDLMNALAAVPSKSRIVILDACRNNPFSEINKTTGRGLAIVDAPSGSLVSYSTAPGTEAQDGDGANSPFTAALLKVGQRQGMPIEQILKQVRQAVNETTNRQQTPWESSSLTNDFSFFPSGSGQAPAGNGGQQTRPVSGRSETRSVESWQKELKSHTPREAYDIVIREDEIEAYQAYLALYPSQSLGPVVRSMVERRREMIAWHDAVTVNTVVSYQTFLAAYSASDFAATANRLVERARTRSVSNAASAFASVGPTCSCSQPTSPAPRPRRADLTPNGNPGDGPIAPVTVYDPPVVYTDPVPVVPPTVTVVTPLPPRIHLPPRGEKPPIGDYPRGGDEQTGNDKPGAGKPGTGKPPVTGVVNSKISRRQVDETPRIRTNSSSNNVVRSIGKPKWEKPVRPQIMTNSMNRGVMFNRGMMMGRPMMGPRPSLGASFMGGRRFF
jgi:hypothetical protein